MTQIHPLAHVDAAAQLGTGVRIGPYCHVGADVVLGDGCHLIAHVTLLGPSEFGPGNVFYPGCVLGAPPQDLKYKGGPTRLVAGSDNTFREYVTAHRGTEVDRRSGGATRIGDHNLLMVGVHVAHDVEIGNHVIIANNVQLAGHIRIEDCVTVGGATAMHHFVTVGRNSYVGGMTRISHDVAPYMKVVGYEQEVRGVNVEGLRRWRFSDESIDAIKKAWRMLYVRKGERSPGRMMAALAEIESNGLSHDEHVRYLLAFLRQKLEKGIYGRAREFARSDSRTDNAAFYARAGGEAAPQSREAAS